MGKGTILENLGEGQYRIIEEVDFSNVEDRLVSLLSKESELQSARADAIVQLSQQEAIKDAFQLAIDAYVLANPNTIDDNLRGLIKAQQEAAFNEGSARINLSRIDADIFAAERDIKILDDALEPLDLEAPGVPKPFKREKTAWCADYTTDLIGEVGTIDVNRQVRTGATIIQPGESPRAAAYDSARDGQIQPALAASPYGVYWNAAQLPGAGVWRARHAVGTLEAVNKTNDTATVAMDVREYRFLTVSIGALFPNKQPTISNVPIEYSTCNSEVFEIDDRVVVEFDGSGKNPVVIGFEVSPKQCTPVPVDTYPYQEITTRFDTSPSKTSGYRINIPIADLTGPGGLDAQIILTATISGQVFDFTSVPTSAVGPFDGFYEQTNGLLFRITGNEDGLTIDYDIASSISYVGTHGSGIGPTPITTDSGIVSAVIVPNSNGNISNRSFEDGRLKIVQDVLEAQTPIVFDTTGFAQSDFLMSQYKQTADSGIFAQVVHLQAGNRIVILGFEDGVVANPLPSSGNLVVTTPFNSYGTLPALDSSDEFTVT